MVNIKEHTACQSQKSKNYSSQLNYSLVSSFCTLSRPLLVLSVKKNYFMSEKTLRYINKCLSKNKH